MNDCGIKAGCNGFPKRVVLGLCRAYVGSIHATFYEKHAWSAEGLGFTIERLYASRISEAMGLSSDIQHGLRAAGILRGPVNTERVYANPPE